MSDIVDRSFEDWNRRAALEEIDNLKAIRATSWDEHTHSFRWLMASLLGVNGAACLGIIGQSQIPVNYRLAASAFFVLGILSALLVAVFGQRAVQRSLALLQKIIGYWMTVAQDGTRDEELEAELNDELKGSAWIGLASRGAGWAAALVFLIGVVIAGVGMHAGALQASKVQHKVVQAKPI